MTYEEVINSGKLFNRRKYKDGWYRVDGRGMICHYRDLSIRNPSFTEEDRKATDWHIKPMSNLELINFIDMCFKIHDYEGLTVDQISAKITYATESNNTELIKEEVEKRVFW